MILNEARTHKAEERAEDGLPYQSAHGLRFDAGARRRLTAEIEREAERLGPAPRLMELCASLGDCHYALIWRSVGAPSRLEMFSTATWRHTNGFRFLHLRAVTATGQFLPGDWLGICLAETAQFERGETPAIVAIDAPPEFEREIRRQVIDLGGTAITSRATEADLNAAVTDCIEDALERLENSGSAKLPLSVLVPMAAASGFHRRNSA